MSRITRFAARDPGPAARLVGFLAHLRLHGYRLGVAETDTALAALAVLERPGDPDTVRRALKTVCAGCAEEAARFDDVFAAYWMNDGRVRARLVQSSAAPTPSRHLRGTRTDAGPQAGSAGRPSVPDDGDGEDADRSGTGRLMASDLRTLIKTDLRDLVSAEDVRQAEAVAHALGQALRDRRSRRRKAARRGRALDFRRTLRASLPTGGEPVRLHRRTRPDRPVKIVALADVSGSMMLYARPFLAFLAGLMRADPASDAYLFHTRLVRIADALRDPDPIRALNRVTLLADGMGGGSKIGVNLDHFARTHARRVVNGRSVVLVLSDGYDTDPPAVLDAALARLRRRGCRIVWLNPLKGWAGYEPVARGMAAALPHLDHFAAANTLGDLARLDRDLGRL